MLSSLASVLLGLLPFVGTLYGGELPSLFFRIDGGDMRNIPSRTAYLERNVDPQLGEGAWRQADAISLWVVEHIMVRLIPVVLPTVVLTRPSYHSMRRGNCRYDCPVALEAWGSNDQVIAACRVSG